MAIQALVMGFGGTGAHVLTSLKELTVLKHGQVPDTIKFLLFDTIADWKPGLVQSVGGGAEEKTAESEDKAASLDPLTEYFQLQDFQPDLKTHVFEYLSPAGNPDDYGHLKNWLHAPWLSQHIPLSQLGVKIGAAQQRQIGRYAMFKNAEKIVAHLRPIMRNLSLKANGLDVNVWLICSSAGGTGAGCLLDAAYLTRLAAESISLKVSGVIVLPNVYMNVRGISQGRAYSLLRELERVQEQGVPLTDRYVDLSKRQQVSSRVVYDRSGQQVALVKSRLFDDLFYLGNDCAGDEQRREFFTSVASAIDPYLDSESGPTLLEKAVNETAAASCFGAARIYVPTETLTEKFAWEDVGEYLRRAAAPREVGDRVEGLYVGADTDRSDSANQKFRGILELFKQLLSLDLNARARETFARNELDARKIVTVWYELTGGNTTPDEQAILLTYAEPVYSLTEPERPKDSNDWHVKTYKENSKSPHGVKESQDDSRGRFADGLEEIKKRYTNPNGGERTFEKGRLHVLETISKRLRKSVDELFIREIEQQRAQFAQSQNAPDQGTPLTRLYSEVTWMLSDHGPARKAHEIVGQFVAAVGREEAERNNRYKRTLQELREARKGGMLSFGTWVETYQQAARDEGSDYLRWYQKHELLKDMQQLVLNVEKRLRQWQLLLAQLFDLLVKREATDDGDASALFNVTQIQLKGTLEKRLNRAARNRTAMISFGEQPDPGMHGYHEELRNRWASGLAADLLNRSHWECGLTSDEMPTITLVIDLPPGGGLPAGERRYAVQDIRGLSRDLHQYFYKRIDERLGNTDIFDYLIWLQEHRNINSDVVVQALNSRANSLIDAGGVPEARTLVYRAPSGSNKETLADSIRLKLGQLEDVEQSYSDHNAITLIKVKKPSLNQIRDIELCRNSYSDLRADSLNDDQAHDTELRRAQVFHPFRQELEAWYIERYYRRKESSVDVPTLPPRIARLLEDPEMMQIFVHGIATGAVEPGADGWVWHGPNEDILLTSKENEPQADVIKAAVIFALRQGEGRPGGLRPITREGARLSVNHRAQAQGKTRDQMLVDFVNTRLDNFLNENAPEQMRKPLSMVFKFYCDPGTRTALQLRVDLP
jgi:hypothetical protein